MLRSKKRASVGNGQMAGRAGKSRAVLCLLVATSCLLLLGCRQDMQDQPRYEVYEPSAFFKDGLSSRPLVEGTVPRGYLRADTQLYTGKMSKTSASATSTAAGATQGTEPGSTSPAGASTSGPQAAGQAAGGTAGTPTGAGTQTGAGEDDDAESFPFPVTAEVMNRGQERYQIFCAMCHGATGEGDGMIVRRGFRKPPSYQEERLRQARVGYVFRVITEGFGAMPSYRAQIPVQDRWAITAYVRALQLSRMNQQAAPAATNGTQPETGGHR